MKIPWDPKILVPLVYAAICWIIVIIDTVLPNKDKLTRYGIVPRKVKGLVGIFFAPFLHGGILEVLTSTVGILFLGYLSIHFAHNTYRYQ